MRLRPSRIKIQVRIAQDGGGLGTGFDVNGQRISAGRLKAQVWLWVCDHEVDVKEKTRFRSYGLEMGMPKLILGTKRPSITSSVASLPQLAQCFLFAVQMGKVSGQKRRGNAYWMSWHINELRCLDAERSRANGCAYCGVFACRLGCLADNCARRRSVVDLVFNAPQPHFVFAQCVFCRIDG